jgi:hypothetical protein
MKLQKIITGLVLVIALIGGALWTTMNSGIDKLMEESGSAEAKDLVKFPEENPELFDAATAEISPLYTLVIVIGVILLLATLLSVVNGLMKNSGSIKRVAFGVLIFAVVLIGAYIFSTGADKAFGLGLYEYNDTMATEGQSKLVGAGLIAFYILTIGAIVAMVLSGVKKVFNK